MHRLLWFWLGLVVLCLAACDSRESAGSVTEQPIAGAKKSARDVTKEPPATAVGKASHAATAPFRDEPAAHALYNQMIEAMRKADSLSYVCHYQIRGERATLLTAARIGCG